MDRSHNEPKQLKGIPRCPNYLDAVAKQVWRQVLPMLQKMGVLSRIDTNALIRYCTFWSHWRRAEAFIAKHGDVYPLKDGNGRIKCMAQFPQVSIAHKLGMLLTRMEAEFGMTPSARTRIAVTEPMEFDPMLDDPNSFKNFLRRANETS
jgi:P27 family predicted phage terminase small subunit